VIPVKEPKPSRFEQCWEPGPIANSRFTEAERKKIYMSSIKDLDKAIEQFAPGWNIANCGDDVDVGLHGRIQGKDNVLVTHPLDEDTACVLSKRLMIPQGKKSSLRLVVGHDPNGDWELIVKADGKEMTRSTVGKKTATDGWMDVSIDLSAYAGDAVQIELANQANGWEWETGLWAQIDLVSE